MTISVCVAVNDGLVLASDSATTMRLAGGDKQVYNHADKIFNLFKGLPIGAATWGLGSIGSASMATLSKDFRRRLTDSSSEEMAHLVPPWGICTNNYGVADVADKFRQFLSDNLNPILVEIDEENERRRQAAEGDSPAPIVPEPFTLRVAGYSAPPEDLPEVYDLHCDGRTVHPPAKVEAPISWGGQCDAIQRLLLGLDGEAVRGLEHELGYDNERALSLAQSLVAYTERTLVFSAMPIIDAIDLARFLVNTTIQFYRFLPGAQIVGGPVEVATITRHEGFKWIERKHFFNTELNPPQPVV